MIKVKDLVKYYGTSRALNKLNMHVPKGVVYGLVGPNGAGKTTLLQHINAAMHPDSGEVLISDEPIFENTQAKARIASIPSDFYYYNSARICDMRDLHASLFPSFDKKRFEELAEVFDMDVRRTIRSLSKGMKKQVAFWLALSQRPEILLLDEPADGLDPTARYKVWGIVMGEVAERGMTVLSSSHNLRELTDVCDYVGIMEKGQMRIERSLGDLQENFAKVQLAFKDDTLYKPQGFEVLSEEQQGHLFTLVLKGDASKIENSFAQASPTFINVLPLSLEEIFIYELGGGANEYAAN